MTWNYRIISHPPHGLADEKGARVYRIHEVYSDESGIIGFSEDGIEPYGESAKELLDDLIRMKMAFEKPELRVEDIEASIIAAGSEWGLS